MVMKLFSYNDNCLSKYITGIKSVGPSDNFNKGSTLLILCYCGNKKSVNYGHVDKSPSNISLKGITNV